MTVPKLARIYAVSINGNSYQNMEPRETMSFYYLDGEAEAINGYDICDGNLLAFAFAQSQTTFDAVLVFPDGEEKPCKVSSFFDNHLKRMKGYVWLADDESVQPFINKSIDDYGQMSAWYHIDEKGEIHFKHDKQDSINK